MRNSRLVLAVMVMFCAGAAWAGSQNDAGCGVGSLIFKDNQPLPQILAATTNATLGNQTFGITSGTLGCTSGGIGKVSKIEAIQENFVVANVRDLSRDMAAGRGEYVTSLSALMGCSKDAMPKFAQFAQSHYQSLFPADNTAPQAMLQTLRAEAGQNAELASSCPLL